MERADLAEQFDDLAQQEEADALGMWTFLATEILFFGGLFTSYIVFRSAYPEAWSEGSHHNNLLLGSINTAVLLTSSLTMALSVNAAQEGQNQRVLWLLLATLLMGCGFLGIKGYEYHEHLLHDLVPGPGFPESLPGRTELFFFHYWVMTAIHALHLVVGIAVLAVIAWMAWKGRFSTNYYAPVEVTGLYWHFVDIVWVFLYPMFYLVH